ncbi:ribonuclease H-like domain-containing protein [Tanacetum coccineum]
MEFSEGGCTSWETHGFPAPKTAKQLTAKRNQERVKSILLLAIPDEYLLKFHNVPDAKSLWAAIKSRFGGNDESKKMQRNVLKPSQLKGHFAKECKSGRNQRKDLYGIIQRPFPPQAHQVSLTMRPMGKRVVHTVSIARLISTARPGNPESILQDHAVVDSGCSSHMTGNKAYLSDYKDYNGGFVAFVKCPKGGFLLKSIVLRAPRQNGVYSLDLKNIVPSGGLENQLNHKVKIIRSDHGTEFKNHAMNEFCAKKGIKREFSVARTPWQNGVAERKNRTLIEAPRTMLADSLLPITFWVEAVNTACYVLNRIPWENLMGNPELDVAGVID